MTNCEVPALERTIDGRRTMRSIADAREALRNKGHIWAGVCLGIRTGPLPGQPIDGPSLVFVIPDATAEANWGVALPTSCKFTGRLEDADTGEHFPISQLDRASANEDGTVILADGTRLEAVSVIPTHLPWELGKLQKRIVYWTIEFMGAEKECYRYGPPSPDLLFLDYSALHKLNPPKLEAIVQHIVAMDPTLKATRQTIANALNASGLRNPRRRCSTEAADHVEPRSRHN